MASEIPWTTDWDSALDAAGSRNVPALVYLFGPTCQGSAATDAITYRDASVVQLLSTDVVACRIDRKAPESADVVARVRHVWTPDFRIVGADGFNYYQWHGYLPPSEFHARVLTGLGRAHLQDQNWEQAETLYRQVVDEHPTSLAAPEALYYLGVAHFKVSGDRGDLEGAWARLSARYPDSSWRVHRIFDE